MAIPGEDAMVDKIGHVSLATVFAGGAMATGAATGLGIEMVNYLLDQGEIAASAVASALPIAGAGATVGAAASSCGLYREAFTSSGPK